LNHRAAGGESEGAAGLGETRKALHNLPNHGAINVVHGRHVQNDVIFLILDVVLDFLINAFAIGAHLHATAQFQNPDAGLDLFLFQKHAI
jgi:hypothetical protein